MNMMYSFKNDYAEGAHPNILHKLIETNLQQQLGYGEDDYSFKAKEMIRQKIQNSNAKIYFLSGGTQTNLIVISALLRPHEAVISTKTGHIYANETGAIEAVGHRVIPVETEGGKLQVEQIGKILQEYNLRPHVVKPKLVYISNSTELGTIYSKEELERISNYCKLNSLYLFLDGARLGHALTAEENDLSLSDIADLTDVFYIGGTKNGALIGEAVIFNHEHLANDFDYMLKQKGALLAKGRLLGIQFLELFKNDLYFSLAKHANQMAMKIATTIMQKGYTFLSRPQTNQIFPILPRGMVAELKKQYDFYEWKTMDEKLVAVRIITSWATEEDKVDQFIEALKTEARRYG